MSNSYYIPKTDTNRDAFPELAVYKPTGFWLRVIALAIIHSWPNVERYAWGRLDALREITLLPEGGER